MDLHTTYRQSEFEPETSAATGAAKIRVIPLPSDRASQRPATKTLLSKRMSIPGVCVPAVSCGTCSRM